MSKYSFISVSKGNSFFELPFFVKNLKNDLFLHSNQRIMSKIDWQTVREFEDITYKKYNGVARIAFNRPDVRNAFRPKTTSELLQAFHDAQEDTSIGVVLLSAEGPSSKDGVWSFCSGGDQKARGHQGYVGEDGYHRLNILDVQRLIYAKSSYLFSTRLGCGRWP
jgi:1,4-dihydroxy-2-naphthoyl-CoA synthase